MTRSPTQQPAPEVQTDINTPPASPSNEPPQLQIDPLPSNVLEKNASQRSFKRPFIISAVVICVLVASVFGARHLVHAFAHESTEDAYVEGHIVTMSSKASGHVVKLHVQDNQLVRKGDLLLEIDPRDFEAQVRQARATLDAAIARHRASLKSVELTSLTTKATLEQASSGLSAMQAQTSGSRDRLERTTAQIANAEAGFAEARAQVVAADAEQTRADADAKRYAELFAKTDISKQRYEQAIAVARTAQANLDAARQRVTAAEAQIAQFRAERAAALATIKQSEAETGEARGRLTQANSAPQQVAVTQAQAETSNAEVEQAKVALATAELNLSYTKVYAMESGRIARRTVEEGAYVQVSQGLLSIVPETIWIVANFKETQLAYMNERQEVEIEIDAFADKTFRGKVDSFQAGTGSKFSLLPPDNATGNFTKVVQRVPVKIVFDSESLGEYKRRIAPGMSVVVSVKVK